MKRRGKNDDIYRNARKRLMRIKEQLVKERGCHCEICGKKIPIDALTIHHVVPVVESPSLMTRKRNIQLLCQKCHVELHRQIQREQVLW